MSQVQYEDLRTKYPYFCYRSYEVSDHSDYLELNYRFEIEGLAVFTPTTRVYRLPGWFDVDPASPLLRWIAFNIGMVELVSYWKATCSPRVIVEAGSLDSFQRDWWKKLYFYGLGEFFYRNGIKDINMDDFMELRSTCEDPPPHLQAEFPTGGNMIPVGGGKDSIVTLELLQEYKEQNTCLIINPRKASLGSAHKAGYPDDKILKVKREIDANLLDLNRRGFLNGHTPFSAVVAFISLLGAALLRKKYIVLSNESSANEASVMGTFVNHQYSKSLEFELDFNEYIRRYLDWDIHYFSLLRPLNELQIARAFARCKEYHHIFRSCNVGSKTDDWCGRCSKCLFVYITLAPYLDETAVIDIFGRNLLDDMSLKPELEGLIGVSPEKPFECVGTRDEVNYALQLLVEKYLKTGSRLPALLDYYRTVMHHFPVDPEKVLALGDFSNIPAEFRSILRDTFYKL